MTSFAAPDPMTVPIAAEKAIPNKAKTHKPNAEISGKRSNITAAATVDKAHGQIRRGAGRLAIATQSTVAKAASPLNGRISRAEKSTLKANPSYVCFPYFFEHRTAPRALGCGALL